MSDIQEGGQESSEELQRSNIWTQHTGSMQGYWTNGLWRHTTTNTATLHLLSNGHGSAVVIALSYFCDQVFRTEMERKKTISYISTALQRHKFKLQV